MKKKNKTIDELIIINKYDILIYLIMLLIIFSILLYISYKTNIYYYLILMIFHIFLTIEKVESYFNLKNIKKYIENNKLKIGTIFYWNELKYMLTDNYLILKDTKNIKHFKYSDISEIEYIRLKKTKNLLIELKNKEFYQILISTSYLTVEEFKDPIDFLLEKNPNIKIKEKL